MAEPKIIRLCGFLSLDVSPVSFNNNTAYRNVQNLLANYAPSTAEDYIWRLCRFLKPHNLSNFYKYDELLTYYKTKYHNN